MDGKLLRRNSRSKGALWLNGLDRILAEDWLRWAGTKGGGEEFDQILRVVRY